MPRIGTILLLFFIICSSRIELSGQITNEFAYYNSIRRANNFYKKGNYFEALDIYGKVFPNYGSNIIDLYNAACAASLVDSLELSNRYLLASITKGYIDVEWLNQDEDFSNLKKTEYWAEITTLIQRKRESIIREFEEIKNHDIHNLVPYKRDNLWGYMLKGSSQVVVEAKFYKVYFPGDCLKIDVERGYRLNVQSDGSVLVYRSSKSKNRVPPLPPYYGRSPSVDNTEGFNGFRVNNKGRITHVSSAYDKTEWVNASAGGPKAPTIEIMGPFKINDKWYAVVQKDNRWGVIDEEGNELEKVKFLYDELIPLPSNQGEEVWFYFKDFDDVRGFISSLGEKKFVNEFSSYPFTSKNIKGLIILRNSNGKNGVINVKNMEWELEPIDGTILEIKYSFLGGCYERPSSSDFEQDRIVDFYFFVRDQNKDEYYIDVEGNKYISKE